MPTIRTALPDAPRPGDRIERLGGDGVPIATLTVVSVHPGLVIAEGEGGERWYVVPGAYRVLPREGRT